MIRRAPYMPVFRFFFLVDFALMFTNLSSTITLGLGRGTPGDSGLLAAVMACVFEFAFPLLPFAILPWLGVTEPKPRGPLWRAWVLYYLVFGGCTLAAELARGLVLESAVGWHSTWRHALLAYADWHPALGVMFVQLESATAAGAAARREQAALNQEIEQLFASREALIAAHSRRRQEVVASLAERAAPRLEALEHELERLALAVEAGRAVALDPVGVEIERLAEDEFRRLSHVLHPSIVQVGLVPALDSLVDGHPLGERVTLAVPAAEARLDAGLPERGVLAAYRAVESVLDRVARDAGSVHVTLDRAPGAELSVTIEVAGTATTRSGLATDMLDCRVALAGGRWWVEQAPEDRTRLHIELPGS